MPSMLRRGWFYPWPAAAYLIKARKRVYTLTPIRPRLRERPRVFGGLVEPERMSQRRCEIYTDGACRGNPGPGGWAAVLSRRRAARRRSPAPRA